MLFVLLCYFVIIIKKNKGFLQRNMIIHKENVDVKVIT